MAGRPLRRARLAEQQASTLATDPATKRTDLPAPRTEPASYSADLLPELLALAADGYASVEIAAHWAVSEETLQDWAKAHPEFKEALSHARALEKAWWMSRARLALRDNNNKFPAGAWSHVMRARFPEFADGPGVQINIGAADRLVIVTRRDPYGEQLTGGQSPGEANALIEGEASGLDAGPEAPGRPAGGFIAGPDGDQ